MNNNIIKVISGLFIFMILTMSMINGLDASTVGSEALTMTSPSRTTINSNITTTMTFGPLTNEYTALGFYGGLSNAVYEPTGSVSATVIDADQNDVTATAITSSTEVDTPTSANFAIELTGQFNIGDTITVEVPTYVPNDRGLIGQAVQINGYVGDTAGNVISDPTFEVNYVYIEG